MSAVDRWEATGEMRRRIIEGAAAAGIEIGWQVAPATRGKIAAAEED